MAADDLIWYERLCGELDRLELEFQLLSQADPCLSFGIFESCDWQDQHVSIEGWRAFQSTAEGQIDNGKWEEWENCPRGCCGCFFGNPNLLSRFRRLASSGIIILSAIDRGAINGRPTPLRFSLDLPKKANFTDWIWLLFETANLSTAWLRFTEYRFWNLPISTTLDDLDENELWETTAMGVRFPRHPLYRTLHMDLFSSSAEAIRLWRHRVEAIEVDGRIDDSIISLPDPHGVAEIEETNAPTVEHFSAPVHKDAAERPDWDGYELRGRNGQLVKTYSDSATTVVPLLDAFQSEGWPRTLSDPCDIRQKAESLAARRGTNPKSEVKCLREQRRQTAKALNSAQSEIYFKCFGGNAVAWKWRDELEVNATASRQ